MEDSPPDAASGPDGARRWGVALASVVLLGTAAVWLNPFVVWDDGVYISHNPLVTDPSAHPWSERFATRALSYPLPLPVFLYGLVYSVSSDAIGFHGLSAVVHLANTLLLYRLLRDDAPAGWAAAFAALWALHPIVVEPLAWATGLKDLLVGTGALLALWGLRRGGAWPLLGGTIAILSKPNAVALGIGLLVIAWRRPGVTGRTRATRLSLVAVAVAGLAMAWFSVANEPAELRASLDIPVSATRVCAALGLQLVHIVAPIDLSHVYAYERVGVGITIVGGLGILVIVAALVAWMRNADPRLDWLLLGGAIWAPSSNLQPLHRFTADSFAYVPWACLAAIVCLTWVRHEARAVRTLGSRRIPVLVLGGLVLVAALGSQARIQAWSSTSQLWAAANQSYPDEPRTIFRLGEAYGLERAWSDERATYMSNLATLERYEQVPASLPLAFEYDGNIDEAERWYSIAFSKPGEQPEALYVGYVEFVGRHPERFDPKRQSDALRYSLGLWSTRVEVSALAPTQLRTVAGFASALGRPEVAERATAEARRRPGVSATP